MTKFLAALAAVSTALLAFAPPASADNTLTHREQNFGDAIAEVLCDGLDTYGVTEDSMFATMTAIADSGHFTLDNAVDVINYVVYEHCPRHWDDLVAFGDSMRRMA